MSSQLKCGEQFVFSVPRSVGARRSIATMTFAAALVGGACRSSGSPTHRDPTVPDSKLPAVAAEYATGAFCRGEFECTFARRGATPMRFICGEIMVGIKPGVTRGALRSLLEPIGDVIGESSTSGNEKWFRVRVRPGTEREVLLHLYRDSRVRYAEPNWSRGGPR